MLGLFVHSLTLSNSTLSVSSLLMTQLALKRVLVQDVRKTNANKAVRQTSLNTSNSGCFIVSI